MALNVLKSPKIFFEKSDFNSLQVFLKKNNFSHYYILCDENTMQHCLPPLVAACQVLVDAEIIEVESGEKSKSLDICALIWQTLLENQADRNTLLINLGGGVITDLGGFCASIYKRGISFIHIPSSSLAMADAAIGGKTGIDFAGIKNSIGTFQNPEAIFVYPGFLNTLPIRQLQNGLAEIYKIALVADKKLWEQLQSIKIEAMIRRSISLKKEIVEKDPHEKNLRKILNFGHTLGHAIEALLLANAQDILHGEAILAGMIMETHLSWQKKLINREKRDEIIFGLSAWFELPPLNIELNQLMPYLLNDKKNQKAQLNFALLSGIGKCETSVPCTLTQINKALSFYHTWAND